MEVPTETISEKDLEKPSKKESSRHKGEKAFEQLVDENKAFQLTVKKLEKKITLLQREKEHLNSEQAKSGLKRSRLEQLCRELQKHNKLMKEESIQRVREEEDRRKEVSAKFHATLAEITGLMQQNSESNAKLRDENVAVQTQFKRLCDQYELREQQVDKMSKQINLERELAEAKLAQMKAQLVIAQSKCEEHEKTEESLRQQINVYFEKYDEFQSVLTKSNEVYSGFKTEMDKMSQKMTRLEKETTVWKQKWETTHKALLTLAAEKQVRDNEYALQTRQLQQLQKLCRTLQSDRASLILQLTANGLQPNTTSPTDSNKAETDKPVDEPPAANPDDGPESKPIVETPPVVAEESQPAISTEPLKPSTDDIIEPEKEMPPDPAAGDSIIVSDETALNGGESHDEKVNNTNVLKQPQIKPREGRRRRK